MLSTRDISRCLRRALCERSLFALTITICRPRCLIKFDRWERGLTERAFTKQYRAKAAEYGELVKTSIYPNQRRDFQKIEQSFTVLADNEQWLANNYQNTLHASEQDPNGATLAEEEEHILRCLGGALIMQRNTLPSKLQREPFDNAGSMGDL